MTEEDDLFHAEVRDVRPLRTDRVVFRPPPPPPIPRQHELDIERAKLEMLAADADVADLETGEELLYFRPGVDRQSQRRLRQGQYSVQGELDLHGMTTEVARVEVLRFLAEATLRDIRCVRIIHGKGYRSPEGAPILKRKLDAWLRRHGHVLGYCSARPVDGGTGAVYVLLARN